MHYQFSASNLELYRQYEEGDLRAERLIEAIAGLRKWGPELEVGSAVHAVVEYGHERFLLPDGETVAVQAGDMPRPVLFTKTALTPVINYRAKRPRMANEARIQHTASVPFSNDTYTLNMRIDVVWGNIVEDVKTTQREVYVTDFERSAQWRCYLLAARAEVFNYQVFRLQFVEQAWLIEDPVPVQLFAYETMQDDISELAAGLIHFCRQKGLEARIEKWK